MSVCCVVFVLFQWACIPLGSPSPVNVILKQDGLELKEKKVVVPDFYVPEHGAGLGSSFADTLQTILLERSLFLDVQRNLPVVWTHPGETRESRFAGLAGAAFERGFDFVLIGVVDDLFYGGLENTRISVTLRLLDTQSGKAVFVAAHQAVSKPRDPSYPLDTKLTSSADSPGVVMEKLLRQIVPRLR